MASIRPLYWPHRSSSVVCFCAICWHFCNQGATRTSSSSSCLCSSLYMRKAMVFLFDTFLQITATLPHLGRPKSRNCFTPNLTALMSATETVAQLPFIMLCPVNPPFVNHCWSMLLCFALHYFCFPSVPGGGSVSAGTPLQMWWKNVRT